MVANKGPIPTAKDKHAEVELDPEVITSRWRKLFLEGAWKNRFIEVCVCQLPTLACLRGAAAGPVTCSVITVKTRTVLSQPFAFLTMHHAIQCLTRNAAEICLRRTLARKSSAA